MNEKQTDVRERVSLATGEAFRAVERAILSPAGVTTRLPDESMERWQTRAVMAVLGRAACPDCAGRGAHKAGSFAHGKRPEWDVPCGGCGGTGRKTTEVDR